jgi:hypothetical protein
LLLVLGIFVKNRLVVKPARHPPIFQKTLWVPYSSWYTFKKKYCISNSEGPPWPSGFLMDFQKFDL